LYLKLVEVEEDHPEDLGEHLGEVQLGVELWPLAKECPLPILLDHLVAVFHLKDRQGEHPEELLVLREEVYLGEHLWQGEHL
jgi:hypothetical protein